MTKHIKLMAILTAGPGKAEELIALLSGMAPYCRAEPGNLRWDVWQDQSGGGRYVVDELYLDDAAVAAHRDTPHYQNYLSRIDDLGDRTVFVLRPADVAET
jgi:quinol monooxygenase YgiN